MSPLSKDETRRVMLEYLVFYSILCINDWNYYEFLTSSFIWRVLIYVIIYSNIPDESLKQGRNASCDA